MDAVKEAQLFINVLRLEYKSVPQDIENSIAVVNGISEKFFPAIENIHVLINGKSRG